MPAGSPLRLFFIARVFVGFFLALVGIGMLFQGEVIAGALIAALGLTFFFLLWLKIRRDGAPL